MDSHEQLGPEVVADAEGNLRTVIKADETGDKNDGGRSTPTDKTNTATQTLILPEATKKAFLQSTSQALDRLMPVVKAIKEAEPGEEKRNASTPDYVEKELRAVSQILTSALEHNPSEISEEDEDGLHSLFKSGTKLAGKRREQLKSVIELLQKLLEEVLPEQSSPAFMKKRDTESESGEADSAQNLATDVAEITNALKAISDGITQLKKKVKGQDEEISRLKKSTGLPASREVETARKQVQPKPVSWPMDMNRPLSRDQVAKEVSFFDE